jgi:hypothetical protein
MRQQIQGNHSSVIIHLSHSFLYSAFHSASLSKEIEETGDKHDKENREQHRGFIVTSILSSVGFLEAAINELYARCNDDAAFIILGIAQETALRLHALWQVENFQRTARVLEKYQIALQMAEIAPTPMGENPYQDANIKMLNYWLIYAIH